jgi:small multidrug resistance pump
MDGFLGEENPPATLSCEKDGSKEAGDRAEAPLHRRFMADGCWMTGWIYLGLAIVLEVVATTLLKLSDGLAKWEWAAASILFYALCFLVFAPSLKTIPVGVAYAVWSGVGIVAMAVIGILFFDQRLSAVQIGCMALVLIGAIGLQVSTRT